MTRKPTPRERAAAPFRGPMPTKTPKRVTPWTRPLTENDKPTNALEKRKPTK